MRNKQNKRGLIIDEKLFRFFYTATASPLYLLCSIILSMCKLFEYHYEDRTSGESPPAARLREFFLFASTERVACSNLFETFGDCFFFVRRLLVAIIRPLKRTQKITGIRVVSPSLSWVREPSMWSVGVCFVDFKQLAIPIQPVVMMVNIKTFGSLVDVANSYFAILYRYMTDVYKACWHLIVRSSAARFPTTPRASKPRSHLQGTVPFTL